FSRDWSSDVCSSDLATAALLVEVVRADYREQLPESETVFELLKDFFDLTSEETKLLMEEARAEADHAASLQGFTRRLHEHLSIEIGRASCRDRVAAF